jgi:hypothetical protein
LAVYLGGSVCDEAKEERAQGAEVGCGGKGDGGGQKTVAVVPGRDGVGCVRGGDGWCLHAMAKKEKKQKASTGGVGTEE